jgi:3-hydroxybutyryl-CoA dehydrogenase
VDGLERITSAESGANLAGGPESLSVADVCRCCSVCDENGEQRKPIQFDIKGREELVMGIRATRDSTVAVLGLGLMGRSIAACLLSAGHRVIGVTDNLVLSAEVPARIRLLIDEMAAEGLLAESADVLMERFLFTGELKDVAGAEIVFESVTEDTELKHRLIKELEQVVSSDCILASNTSAIPVSLLQENVRHPDRILAVHWDDPAHIKRFLEIAPGPATSRKCVEYVAALASRWGKEPSILQKEIRGFITNRISRNVS